MLAKRSNIILLAAVGLLALGVTVYFLFFAGAGYVEGRPTLKYFRLSTCHFCQEMNPIMAEIKKDYSRKINFVYVEMDTANGKKQAREAGVMGTPTFLLFGGDGDQVYHLQGSQPRAVIEQQLDMLLERE